MIKFETKIILLIVTIFSLPAYSYDRSSYRVWSDLDKNCKNTRIDVLEKRAIRINSISCTNINGTWIDYYSEKILTNESVIDLDHVIPLSYADKIGASNWDIKTKRKFANDPDNLVITHRSINRQKGDKGLSKWLPIEFNVRCDYLLKWVHVINKYNLTLPNEDKVLLERYKPFCEKVSSAIIELE